MFDKNVETRARCCADGNNVFSSGFARWRTADNILSRVGTRQTKRRNICKSIERHGTTTTTTQCTSKITSSRTWSSSPTYKNTDVNILKTDKTTGRNTIIGPWRRRQDRPFRKIINNGNNNRRRRRRPLDAFFHFFTRARRHTCTHMRMRISMTTRSNNARRSTGSVVGGLKYYGCARWVRF